MYELKQVGENTFYMESPAKIGLYRLNEHEVVLIDSGSDKDAGRKVRQILDREGWSLRAIYNTHSNADHIGGNAYLQKQKGCPVYAPGIEAAFTNYPCLEPSFLYGGFPPAALRNKFLMARSSLCEELKAEDLPEGFEIIPLPGHFFDMAGFRTPDDVVFLADCLSSKATLDKYKIGFIYDVQAYLETLEKVKQLKAAQFVPAHASATDSVAELAQCNIDTVQEIGDTIVELLQNPMTFEELLKALFDRCELIMNFDQYVLVGSTVRSYLAWLEGQGRVSHAFVANRLLWQAV